MGIQRDKLERSLGGIAEMTKIPDMIFVIDTNVEDLAVKEALKLNIPIVAILDTNSDPVGINYPIPGNDDARRAINLYCDLVKQTILDANKEISIKSTQEPQVEQKTENFKTETKAEDSNTKQKEISGRDMLADHVGRERKEFQEYYDENLQAAMMDEGR